MSLEALAAFHERLLYHEAESDEVASGLQGDLAESLGRAAPGEEVVDDQHSLAGIEDAAGHLHPVLDALGGAGDLAAEGVPVAEAEVLLGVDHRQAELLGACDGGRDA